MVSCDVDETLVMVRRKALNALKGTGFQDAEDRAQEVTLHVWQAMQRGKVRNLNAYTSQVIRNAKSDLLRRDLPASRRNEEFDESNHVEERLPLVSFEDLPSDIYQIGELMLQGYSAAEIAPRLGLSESAIRMRCKRFRETL
jgi:RNA polymerase sigma factor (sigma-70 family)